MNEVKKYKGSIYRYKRYITFVILTIISLGLPFIVVEGNHFFLLSFDHKELHLLFVKFSTQELYLMPFLLILSFIGVFFMTTLGGRVWCGWACPQTIFRVIFRDLIETKILKIRKRISNKQQEPEGQLGKKTVAVLIWTALAFIASSNFTWYFVPPEDFFKYMQNPLEHTVLLGTILLLVTFLVWLVTKSKEEFCIYVCPYARVQSVMYDEETIQTIYNEHRGGEIYAKDKETGQSIGDKLFSKTKDLRAVFENSECTTCESCVKVCPTHIDIRKGTQLECINCLECADACTKVMGALGKKSLISWTSLSAVKDNDRRPKFVRVRTIAYAIALFIALTGLILMGGTKEYMQLSINKNTQLYKVKNSGKRVENAYTFLFDNTQNKKYKFYFEIVNNPDIQIKRPKDAFKLSAGKKTKKVVILYTDKVLAENKNSVTSIPVKIRAFAVDDDTKDKRITIFRETIFSFPKLGELK